MSIVSRGQIRPGEGLRETVSRPLFLFAVLLFPVTVCAPGSVPDMLCFSLWSGCWPQIVVRSG